MAPSWINNKWIISGELSKVGGDYNISDGCFGVWVMVLILEGSSSGFYLFLGSCELVVVEHVKHSLKIVSTECSWFRSS